jgi:hypothetical protein
MTSVSRAYNQVPPNSLYINLVAVQSTIVDSNNNPAPWVVAVGALSTAGAVVFRDMGRQNVRPDPTIPTSVGGQSTLLRKVQLVPTGPAGGYYGTGNSSIAGAGSGTDFYTGYVRLGGFTFGGGNGVPSGFARLN